MIQPIQDFCEVSTPVKPKRQKLNPGTHRMYIPEYQLDISKAETVGDIVKAMHRALATSGFGSDMPISLFRKIERAKKCKDKA